MRASHDSLGGYGWSMIVLYLAQSGRINGRMAALNIFQVVLKFIADKELSRQERMVHCTSWPTGVRLSVSSSGGLHTRVEAKSKILGFVKSCGRGGFPSLICPS